MHATYQIKFGSHVYNRLRAHLVTDGTLMYYILKNAFVFDNHYTYTVVTNPLP